MKDNQKIENFQEEIQNNANEVAEKEKSFFKKNKVLSIILGLALILGFYLVGAYNNLVVLNEGVVNKWAQVENQYQRRLDLISNLVKTVQGAANFEKSTLTEVTQARANASGIKMTPELINDPQAMAKFQAVQGQLSSALSRLLVTVEKYPDLKSNQNFLQLQAQLEGTENRLSVARKDYNDEVKKYNMTIKRFPTVILAKMFGFSEKVYYKSEKGAEKRPEVEFKF